MSNKSRRRVTLAAGAILAGAAIPLAGAGTAWAVGDDATGTGGNTPPVSAATLEHDGATPAEANAVVQAENNGTPVQVNYDGQVIVNDNNPTGVAGDPTATAGKNHDIAIAIGAGSDANAGVAGSGLYSNDNAYANGTNTYANAGGSLGASPGGSYDSATNTGSNSAPNNGDGAGAWGNNDTAIANGGNDSVAAYGNFDYDNVQGSSGFVPDHGSYDAVYVSGTNDNVTDNGNLNAVYVNGGTAASGDYIADNGSGNLVYANGSDIGTSGSAIDVTHPGFYPDGVLALP